MITFDVNLIGFFFEAKLLSTRKKLLQSRGLLNVTTLQQKLLHRYHLCLSDSDLRTNWIY